jgi:hypothetical protein
MLPIANPASGALHLGFEHFVGNPAQKLQGGGHCSAPWRVGALTMVATYARASELEVIAITGFRFLYK